MFVVMSIEGIEIYDTYKKNMGVERYTELLPQIRTEINASDAPFSYFMHDNAWGGSQPRAELDATFGRGRWTQYMGEPCWRPHPTARTPKTNKPTRLPKLRCPCKFPEGAIHAAYCMIIICLCHPLVCFLLSKWRVSWVVCVNFPPRARNDFPTSLRSGGNQCCARSEIY